MRIGRCLMVIVAPTPDASSMLKTNNCLRIKNKKKKDEEIEEKEEEEEEEVFDWIFYELQTFSTEGKLFDRIS
uniref:Uncharacterized protein n=1 Tax=Vespula pensylvanica TaxID=30213 RepID=A0A834PA03_VESPE|nr:hypothetical protein H0235_002383 [Vespula pensylvanica]